MSADGHASPTAGGAAQASVTSRASPAIRRGPIIAG